MSKARKAKAVTSGQTAAPPAGGALPAATPARPGRPADESAPAEKLLPPAGAPHPAQSASDPIGVVGLGASAGGLAVLQTIFGDMPPDSGLAFVVVMHLSPDYESNLQQILQMRTAMPVLQVQAPVRVEANHVYVIPPGHHLAMQNDMLQLTEPQQTPGRRVAIDLFFRTLAAAYGQRAVCVVLSGSDSDGVVGLKHIKEQGGITIAQNPAEAEQPSMPLAAVETGMVDWVLPAAGIAGRLMIHARNERLMRLPPEGPPEGEPGESVVGQPGAPPSARQIPDARDEAALVEVLALLRAETGRDFSHYKRATVLRRIARRMQVNSLEDVPAYLSFLREHAAEAVALLHDLLISVTNFFRDSEAFAAFAAYVPQLFAGKDQGDQLRVWVAGCATGEEAYSIAMLLCEHAARLPAPPSIQIFATDLDEDVIQIARNGLYPSTIEADVSAERLRRFFMSEGNRYRVKKELRELVLFARHDLLKDSPFSRLDLVTCRNLLIYLKREAQERVFEIFHFTLRPGGLLFLGSSESLDETHALFAPLDKKHRVFVRRSTSRPPRHSAELPSAADSAILTLPPSPRRPLLRAPMPAVAASGEPTLATKPVSMLGELHQSLLKQYAPPSLLIDTAYNIIHLSPSVGRYLQFVGGEPSTNLLKAVIPELRIELRTALFRAMRTGAPVVSAALALGEESSTKHMRIHVRPMLHDNGKAGVLLVLFEPLQNANEAQPAPSAEARAAEPVVQHLESEIQQLRWQLSETVEQYEASNEELKASNEELQAMNEEMQSTTEEMETGKEELQSINEELTTVNHELKGSVEEVSRVNSDLQNLMASTEIGTIFLDRELRIKRFTPRAQRLFNILPGDMGRPLSDITHKLAYPNLAADAAGVLHDLRNVEREVESNDETYMVRMLPYRTVDDHIDGVVLTFVDISAMKLAERDLRQAEERFRLLVEGVEDYAMFLMDTKRCIVHWNSGAEHIFGYSRQQAIGQRSDLIFTPEDIEAGVPELEMQGAIANGRADDKRWHVRQDGSRFWADGVMTSLYDEVRNLTGFVKIARDATAERVAADKLHQAQEELEARVAERTSALTQTNQELRRSEERFAKAFDLSPLPGVIVALDGDSVVAINQCALQIMGRSPGEVVGRSIEELNFWVQTPAESALRKKRLRSEHLLRDLLLPFRVVDGEGKALVSFELIELDGRQCALTMFYDVTERYQTEQAREKLLQRIVGVQNERHRISRELHDQLGQQLTALLMGLKQLLDEAANLAVPQIQERVEAMHRLSDNLMQDVHRLAWELRPAALDTFGLEPALRQLVKEWSEKWNIYAEFAGRGLPADGRLSPPIETALYRVVQEALTNVQRHAEASTVSVLLERQEGQVVLIVEDDGRGFLLQEADEPLRPDPHRLGLLGMQERMEIVHGTLDIETSPGNGTTVYARASLG